MQYNNWCAIFLEIYSQHTNVRGHILQHFCNKRIHKKEVNHYKMSYFNRDWAPFYALRRKHQIKPLIFCCICALRRPSVFQDLDLEGFNSRNWDPGVSTISTDPRRIKNPMKYFLFILYVHNHFIADCSHWCSKRSEKIDIDIQTKSSIDTAVKVLRVCCLQQKLRIAEYIEKMMT